VATGIKVCVVFDAKTSLQKEAQREMVSEQLEIVFSAGGVCHLLSRSCNNVLARCCRARCASTR
jgi:predicted RNA-binding protein with PIN domain